MGDSTPATSAPQPTTASPAAVAAQPHFQNASQTPEQSTTSTTSSAAQAQAQAQAAAAVAVVGNQNGSSEDFVCMWQGCSERCTNAEALYEHVCERHVGRKSTNNLNLTCQWGNCRTTTVKRDHITSHIRVHVPLKPHKCDLCGKAFKRPQDLKKHVKTHADDSVLIRSPGPPDTRGQDAPFGMVNNPKGFPTGGHYFEQPMNPVHAGQNYHQPPQYYQGQPHPQPNPAYGNVYYTLNQGDNPSNYDSRKRIYESVNEFFGDTKRRQFDPTSYAAIGQRLGGLQGLQLPMSTGPAPEFHAMQGAVGVAHAGGYGPALAAPAYHLPPMSNARTKHDLIELDRMLDTIHTTVYENDDHVAAAGIAQPGATYIPRANYGTTHHSPPVQLPSSHLTATTTNTTNASIIAASSPGTTPALTPPSSTVSYASSHSPGSYSHRVSPPHQEMAMYPRLPSTSAHDMAAGYVASANAAPPSTLSNNGDYNDRRRWTGGVLERSRPDDLPKAADFEDRERTPTGKEEEAKSQKFHNSLIDPALQASVSASSPSSSPSASSTPDAEAAKKTATDAAKRAEEEWLENVRILEQLRAYVKDRLTRGDYESLEAAGAHSDKRPASAAGSDQMEGVEQSLKSVNVSSTDDNPTEPTEGAALYPTLKMEDDGDSRME